jgi:DNA-directed RNA polymerase subunit omega
VDERTDAEEEAETMALLADPTHTQMSEQELLRALQSDRDGVGAGGALLTADVAWK